MTKKDVIALFFEGVLLQRRARFGRFAGLIVNSIDRDEAETLVTEASVIAQERAAEYGYFVH